MNPNDLDADMILQEVVGVEYLVDKGFAITLQGRDAITGYQRAVRIYTSARIIQALGAFVEDIIHVAPADELLRATPYQESDAE